MYPFPKAARGWVIPGKVRNRGHEEVNASDEGSLGSLGFTTENTKEGSLTVTTTYVIRNPRQSTHLKPRMSSINTQSKGSWQAFSPF